MLRIIDRYVIRETVAPFLLALVVFTFILQMPPLMDVVKDLLEKGVSGWTILRILANLIPQALGVTIPMALLVGLLIGLGKLSADREAVALQACGVSLVRLVRPIAVVSIVGWAITTYVMIYSLPAGNRRYQEILHELVSARIETDVKPRVFFQDFPNLVLYARDVPRGGGGWKDLFLADSRQPDQPLILTARRGRMHLDTTRKTVDLVLEDGSQHRPDKTDPTKYRVERFQSHTVALNPKDIFPSAGAIHGVKEMTIAELKQEIVSAEKQGISTHNLVMAIHQKFSIPVACLVFGLLALSLGISNRKDGKQASFVIGLAVVFVYWVLMYTGQSMAKAHWINASIAMWIPDVVLGIAGVALLIWRHSVTDAGLEISIPTWSSLRHRFPWLPGPKTLAAPGTEATPTAATRHAAGGSSGATARTGTATATSQSTGAADVKRARKARTTADGKRIVVVVRVPQGILPRMRILDSYIGSLYLRVFSLAFLGMLGLFYIATFIDLSDKLFKGTATGMQMVLFLWYSTPQYAYYLLPISALISTLITIGLLTKSSELIVMRACGISLYRVAAPLLALGMVWSFSLFGLEESVLANANREASALRTIMRGGQPRTFDMMNRQWVAGKDGNLYHYNFFDARNNVLNDISIYQFDDLTWRISKRTYATQASYHNGEWDGERGWVRAFDEVTGASDYRPFTSLALTLEPVEYFRTEQPSADRMSFSDLRHYIGELRTSGFDVVPYVVALHRKISFPFVAIVMTLIAVPFAVTTGRRGALYGIAIGIFLAISYWGLFILFTAIGGAGMLTPVLAAWAPNILFLALATWLLVSVRT